MHKRRQGTLGRLNNLSILDAPLTSNLNFKGQGSITVPTIGDSNGDRWGFNGSVWTETDEGEPRFYNGALYMEGSHTELSGYSGDLGNATGWTGANKPTITQNLVGLRGNSNEAFSLEDTDNAAAQFIANSKTVADDNSKHYAVCWVKYNSSPSVYPRIFIGLFNGTTTVFQSIVLDVSDGSYTEPHSSGAVESITRIGDFWRCELSLTNNTSGNTLLSQSLLPAYNTTGTTTEDITATGTTGFAAACLFTSSPSYAPILTTGGSTKTVNADTEYTIPIGNWPDGDVSVEMEVTPFFNSAITPNQGILTPNSGQAARVIYFSQSGAKRIGMSDGTAGFVLGQDAWTNVGDTITIKARASVSQGKMNFSVNGVSATEANYDGSFNPSGSIVLGKSLTRAMAIKNIRIYPVSLGDGWLGS